MGLPLKGSGKSIIDEHIRRDAANQPGIDGQEEPTTWPPSTI
jgi:hypothetical protein